MGLTLKETITQNIKSYLRQNVYTSIPAKVIGVVEFGSHQLVDVEPLINRLYDDGVALQSAIIEDVPVVFPSGGGGLLSFPIKNGDTVLVCFSMRSLSEWLNSTGDSRISPVDNRHYSLTDAIAIPCLYTKSSNLSPNTEDVELKFKETSIKLKNNNDITLNNSNGLITLKNSGEVVVDSGGGSLTLKTDGEVLHSSGAKITSAGDFITALGHSLDMHIHGGVQTGSGNTGVPL